MHDSWDVSSWWYRVKMSLLKNNPDSICPLATVDLAQRLGRESPILNALSSFNYHTTIKLIVAILLKTHQIKMHSFILFMQLYSYNHNFFKGIIITQFVTVIQAQQLKPGRALCNAIISRIRMHTLCSFNVIFLFW